jgi:riboflavin biosynthesis pyrimidine reductase
VTPDGWQERFEGFAAARTADAVAAALPPYRTEIDADPAWARHIGNAWTRARFDGPFYLSNPHSDRPACSLVFVQSADGNTGAPNPSSLGGGSTDKHLIYEGLSRVAADAVLSGAETLRASDTVLSVWHPELVALRASLALPRHPVQAVATLRGVPIDDMLMFNVPDVSAVVVTIPAAADRMRDAIDRRPWTRMFVMADQHHLPAAFAWLRARGVDTLSCIGGHKLARPLLDAGLVDEVYLTTAPRPGGEPDTPIHTRAWRGTVLVRKRGTGEETGVTFEHVVPADS